MPTPLESTSTAVSIPDVVPIYSETKLSISSSLRGELAAEAAAKNLAGAIEPPQMLVAKQRWRHRLPSLVPIFIFAAVYIIAFVLFVVYHSSILPALESFGRSIKNFGVGGYFIIGAALFISSFPPVPGYSMFGALAGLVYGWLGAVPAIIGSLLGAFVCFLVFRKLASRYAQRLTTANPKLYAVVQAIEARGFSLLFLMRLAPYPYTLMNALLGASPHIPVWSYTLATALTAAPKLLIDIAIGANFSTLTASLLTDPSPLGWGVAIVLGLIAVGVSAYLGWIGHTAVKRLQADEQYRQQVEDRMAAEMVSEEVELP